MAFNHAASYLQRRRPIDPRCPMIEVVVLQVNGRVEVIRACASLLREVGHATSNGSTCVQDFKFDNN